MSAHTPGPWICYADLPSTEPNWHIVTTANKMRVLANVHIEPSNEMDAANARLIAAAPELLAALKDVREELRACQAVIHLAGGFDPAYVTGAQAAMKRADAAIEKATGAQS